MITIVLLPGMDGTGTLFSSFVAALGADFETMIIPYSTKKAMGYAELEENVRMQLPIGRPFFLLGESFSGPIAVSLAASQPDGLLGLILCCSFIKNPLPYFTSFRRLVHFLPIKPHLAKLLFPFLLGHYSTSRLCKSLQVALRDISADVIRTRLRAILNVDYSGKLANVRVPILYLCARDDCTVPFSAFRHIANVVPAVRLVSLPGPHMLLQVHPALAARAIGEFIQSTMAGSNRFGQSGVS